MDDVAVGQRVQFIDKNEKMFVGEVVSVTPPKQEKPRAWWNHTPAQQKNFWPTALVKWDDGTEETMSVSDLDLEDSELEREFRLASDTALAKIKKKLDMASKYLDEAVAISEEYGVPFSSGISFLSQSYYPNSFEEKYKDKIDDDFVNSLTGAYSEYGYGGWEHSAVC